MTIKEILIFLSIKYQGSWDLIYKAITKKEVVNEEEVMKANEKLDCGAITLLDEDYPLSLKHCFHPPFVLFYKGDIALLNANIISFVGSRDASDYGLEMTKKLVDDLKDFDCVICSGLAKGVDKIAHEEALKNDMKTIAILPTGIDYCYPKENYYLYEEIAKKGLLISEYPFMTKIEKNKFTSRNRIIAALCSSLVVTAMKERSGTTVSVRFALEYGKDIYVVPYHIDEENASNRLIKDGAYLIESGRDIFENL